MRRLSLLVFWIFVGLAADAFAQTTFSPTDGMTPVGLEAGSPAGSYALGGLDTVNLYNGSANLAIPLLKIGGRGDAGYMMVARYEPHWDGNGFMSTSASDGCSEAAPCPVWAFAPGPGPRRPCRSPSPGATALPGETAAGTLYLRDGRQFHFGDYHIVPGFPSLTVTAVDRLRDRNGNQTTFNYSVTIPNGFQSAFAVIDPLGRVINVAEGQGYSFLDPGCTASCVGVYDQITYGPTGQQKTITVYRRDYWYDRISSLQTSTRPTY